MQAKKTQKQRKAYILEVAEEYNQAGYAEEKAGDMDMAEIYWAKGAAMRQALDIMNGQHDDDME